MRSAAPRRRPLRRLYLRDVPLDVRLAAARDCADAEARRAPDPLTAIREASRIRRLAEDPPADWFAWLPADAVADVLGDTKAAP